MPATFGAGCTKSGLGRVTFLIDSPPERGIATDLSDMHINIRLTRHLDLHDAIL